MYQIDKTDISNTLQIQDMLGRDSIFVVNNFKPLYTKSDLYFSKLTNSHVFEELEAGTQKDLIIAKHYGFFDEPEILQGPDAFIYRFHGAKAHTDSIKTETNEYIGERLKHLDFVFDTEHVVNVLSSLHAKIMRQHLVKVLCQICYTLYFPTNIIKSKH